MRMGVAASGSAPHVAPAGEVQGHAPLSQRRPWPGKRSKARASAGCGGGRVRVGGPQGSARGRWGRLAAKWPLGRGAGTAGASRARPRAGRGLPAAGAGLESAAEAAAGRALSFRRPVRTPPCDGRWRGHNHLARIACRFHRNRCRGLEAEARKGTRSSDAERERLAVTCQLAVPQGIYA